MGSAIAGSYRQLGTNKIKQKSTVGMNQDSVHYVLTARDLGFWSVSLCRLAYSYQCFRGACCFHLQGNSLFLEWMATCSNRRNLLINVFLFVNSEDSSVSVCPICPSSRVCLPDIPLFLFISLPDIPLFSCMSARYSPIPVYLSARCSLIPVYLSALCFPLPVYLSARYSPIPVYLSARYFPHCGWWPPKHALTQAALLPTLGPYRLPLNFWTLKSSVYSLLSFARRSISL